MGARSVTQLELHGVRRFPQVVLQGIMDWLIQVTVSNSNSDTHPPNRNMPDYCLAMYILSERK